MTFRTVSIPYQYCQISKSLGFQQNCTTYILFDIVPLLNSITYLFQLKLSLSCSSCNRRFRLRCHLRNDFFRVHRRQSTKNSRNRRLLDDYNVDDGIYAPSTTNQITTVQFFDRVRNTNSTINTSVCYQIQRLFNSFQDSCTSMYNAPPYMTVHFRLCRTQSDSVFLLHAFLLLISWKVISNTSTLHMSVNDDHKLSHFFQNHLHFHEYCKTYRKQGVVDKGWLLATIQLVICDVNTSWCY